MDMGNNNNVRYKDKVERERSKRKHKNMFWDSSHCSTSPPSHRRISTSPYRIFHKGTSTEKLPLSTGSTQLLSITQTSIQEVGT